MSFPIGKIVIDAIVDRLKDDNDGFNVTFNNLRVDYGVSRESVIDFAPLDGTSKNFVLANLDPSDWVTAANPTFPFVTLFVESSTNQNLQKFHQFSGEVRVGLNVFLSWSNPKLRIDAFEPEASCYEETVFTVFNRARNASPDDQNWGEEITFNGNVSCQRTRLERGENFWRQALGFRMEFEVDQRGEV